MRRRCTEARAEHLYLYSTTPEHDIRDGLLLRCDPRALFDCWLLAIDPDSWTIQVAPSARPIPGSRRARRKTVFLSAAAELSAEPTRLPHELLGFPVVTSG